jgi:hypothetical protein
LIASAAAVLLAALLVAPWFWAEPDRDAAAPRAEVPAPPVPRSEPARPRGVAAPPPVPPVGAEPAAGETPPEPEPVPDPAEEAAAPYVPQRVPYEGPTGMELFPPLGTKPVRIGVVVPDDFELPEGFVRHHQFTDEGEPLPAILMVHPDYELRDESGRPVVTKGGVVPPEYAPEGLPIQLLELPQEEE